MSKVAVGSGLRVMVVDDDPYIVEIVTRILESHGHKVTPVNDGKTALFLLPQVDPEIILLDLGMPGMDGFTILKELKAKAHWARIPVFMLTGHMDRESVEHALRLGAVDYITKPIDPERLLARIDRVIKARVQEAAHRGISW